MSRNRSVPPAPKQSTGTGRPKGNESPLTTTQQQKQSSPTSPPVPKQTDSGSKRITVDSTWGALPTWTQGDRFGHKRREKQKRMDATKQACLRALEFSRTRLAAANKEKDATVSILARLNTEIPQLEKTIAVLAEQYETTAKQVIQKYSKISDPPKGWQCSIPGCTVLGKHSHPEHHGKPPVEPLLKEEGWE